MRRLLYAALAALLLCVGSLLVSTTESYAQTDTAIESYVRPPVIVPRYMQSGFMHSEHRTIDTIVLHSSYNAQVGDPYSVSAIIGIYTRLGVSSHYIIDRDGVIYQLVPDNDISYHCGISRMPDPDGRTGVNAFSIGIELVGGLNDRFTELQYQSLQELIVHLKQHYPISHIVSHGEVAPDRRTDPWNLDWQRVWSW